MTTNETRLEETGLQFFGTLSAAVSHDLKNVLSIINEKAGLLEDFGHMSRRGMAMDVERVDAITAQVKDQVARADRIIRCFNRFAHSVDHPVAATDLGEAVATLVQLAQRLLANLEVAVVTAPVELPVVITTRPLMAQGLIWSGIRWAAAHVGDEREIGLGLEQTPEGAAVHIGPLANLPAGGLDTGFLASTEGLREALNAEMVADAAARKLHIHLTRFKER